MSVEMLRLRYRPHSSRCWTLAKGDVESRAEYASASSQLEPECAILYSDSHENLGCDMSASHGPPCRNEPSRTMRGAISSGNMGRDCISAQRPPLRRPRDSGSRS